MCFTSVFQPTPCPGGHLPNPLECWRTMARSTLLWATATGRLRAHRNTAPIYYPTWLKLRRWLIALAQIHLASTICSKCWLPVVWTCTSLYELWFRQPGRMLKIAIQIIAHFTTTFRCTKNPGMAQQVWLLPMAGLPFVP